MRGPISRAVAVSLLLSSPMLAQSPAAPDVRSVMTEGAAAVQRGDLARAESLFEQATAAAPRLSDAWLGLGLVELRRGSLEPATQALTRATELNPQLPGAHLYLGIAAFQRGQAAAALDALRAELALDPRSVEALRWTGIVDLAESHPVPAAAALDQAVTYLPPGSPQLPELLYYQARAHTAAADQTLRQLYAIDPDSALVHRALAESLAASGQPEKAIAEFQLALKKQPDNPDLLEALGDADQSVSRFDDAEAAYRHELELNPASAIALYNLGKIHVERGKPEQGVGELRRALALGAVAAPARFYLGLGLAELNQAAEAAQSLEQSLAAQPSPFIAQSAWFQLSRVYQRLGRKQEAANALAKLQQLKSAASPGTAGSVPMSVTEAGKP